MPLTGGIGPGWPADLPAWISRDTGTPARAGFSLGGVLPIARAGMRVGARPPTIVTGESDPAVEFQRPLDQRHPRQRLRPPPEYLGGEN